MAVISTVNHIRAENNFMPGENPVNSSRRVFHRVTESDFNKMNVLTEIFNRVLEPLYGSQRKALCQIAEGKDRHCYLLYENEVPAGVLVFKTIPSDEFSAFGVVNSVEVKSLFVDNSQKNSGKGLGSALLNKLHKEIEALEIPVQGMHVTVSESKDDSLAFFQKKGFQIAHVWEGRYKTGVNEYLLYCPKIISSIEKSLHAA